MLPTQTLPLLCRPASRRVTLAALAVAGGLALAAPGCAARGRSAGPQSGAGQAVDRPAPAAAAAAPVAAPMAAAAAPAGSDGPSAGSALVSTAGPAVAAVPPAGGATDAGATVTTPAAAASPPPATVPAAAAAAGGGAPSGASPGGGGAAFGPTPVPGLADLEVKDAGQGLATRFAAAAFDVVQAGDNDRDPAAWRQAAAYLEAAARLDTADPADTLAIATGRAFYHRLRSMALERAGALEQAGAAPKAGMPADAADALVEYLKLNGGDEVARLKLIAHYAARSESNAARLDYLRGLLDKPTVSDEIKSRCATWAAQALFERSLPEAVAMLERAIQLDPLNLEARKLEYAWVAARQGPGERAKSLFAQLRCNPAQPPALWAVGREMAAAGMARDSARWYNAAAEVTIRSGVPIDPGFYVEYAAQLMLNGETKLADDTLTQVVAADKTNVDAWFLRLALRQAAGPLVAYQQDLEQAKRLLAARAGVLSGKILGQASGPGQPGGDAGAAPAGGDAGPASRPFDFAGAFAGGSGGAAAPGAPGAPSADAMGRVVAKLREPTADPFLRREFVSAVLDLAWFELYFNRVEAAAGSWVEVAKQLLAPDDVTLRRLQGWLSLLRGQDGPAMQALWPIRKADALAGMGVVELLSRPGNKWVAPPATAPAGAAPAATKPASTVSEYDPDRLAQGLLDANPAGLTGAMLAGGFRNRKLYARPNAASDPIRAALAQFPIDLMSIVAQPDRYYIPVGESLDGKTYRVGEPVMARVRLQNNSDYDLTIGEDGVIKPDLWFDGRLSLANDRMFPKCGTDRVANALVLKRRSSITQVVRIDQGELSAALRERPAGTVSLYMTTMTNPQMQPDATSPTGMRVIPGPSGVRRQFKDTLIRGGMPLNNQTDHKRLLDLTLGLPTQKYQAIDTLAAFVQQARGNDHGPPDKDMSVALQPEFVEQVARMQVDKVPTVGAWATIASLRLMTDAAQQPTKPRLVDPLVSSPAWEVRLAAVLAARELDPAAAVAVATRLASDPNPIVRVAAAAEAVLAPKRAASKPAEPTAPPATGPAVTPPASPQGSSSPQGPASRPAPPPGQ